MSEAELRRRWANLAAEIGNPPGVDTVGDALLTSWAEPHRAYHDRTHLLTVLHGVEGLVAHATDPAAVRLAAWYHDAVHDGATDDEERSAERAEKELSDLGLTPERIAEVARLVRLTVRHDPSPGDRNGEVLCDADLAVLAGDAVAYAGYIAAVRTEYADVAAEDFRSGRAAVLQDLLDLPSLYRTPHGRAHWEAPARANLSAELAGLIS